jgi:endonuclease YncB( thermonuclease family)
MDLIPNKAPLFSLNGLTREARVIDVYDGDSITCIFKFKDEYYKWKCRLLGIDTPEIRTKNIKEKEHAIKARDYLRSKILHQIVKIECFDFDKYGRLLIKVLDHKNIDITYHLIEQGFGVHYTGGTKTVWKFD